MTPDRLRFDEPALKRAIRRNWGEEKAPADLRERVQAMLADERSGVPAETDVIRVAPSFWRRHARMGMAAAAAAVVLIGASVIVVQMNGLRGRKSGAAPAPGAVAALPTDLGEQLVRSHNRCARLAPHDHHLFTAAPKNDFRAIAAGMAAELRHPVVATSVGDEWEFRGAALCPVGETRSAHLMYGRGDAFVSVFSLPASAFPGCGEQQCCDAAIDGQPVAGFVESGAFYAVVGSTGGKTPVDIEQVRAMRDQIRGDLVAMNRLEQTRFALARP